MAQALTDNFGRTFPYLRLSLTDVCNFSCDYCLPDGFKRCSSKPSFLSRQEIINLVDAFTELGTYKVRLTGGEPTLRRDFVEIVKAVANHPNVSQVALTTNGYRLEKQVQKWFLAGLTHLNVSVDTLDQQRFYQLTGHNKLASILKGIDKALELGFAKIKLNAVLLKGVNDQQLPQFLEYVKHKKVSVRFIELMQTGDNLTYFKKHHVANEVLYRQLEAGGWQPKIKASADGPAVEYYHSDYQGTLGFISPYSKDFCTGCNRLRVTSVGDLRLCLFGEQGVSLRPLLQRPEQQPQLISCIQEQLNYKASSHFLAVGDTGVTTNLSIIGG
ncbi:GTP 3',8-cyclase MoaA [Paraferrimonas sp. SM1919]|uniref:GTP 3',8-cyclase MoaA n=1 Tax=Paraferrimonas sp. SM1919 TaxID=2662263 RepID=UPI0013D5CB09|nr:GTP 3',8-cyclase MoaA [Paraferrimonas sp. SM1919]